MINYYKKCMLCPRKCGTVFFSGCNLRCVYCQNRDIAASYSGFEITDQKLADIFLKLQDKGAHNINLVTPTHYTPHIISALYAARGKLNIPVVYNCGGYESAETLKMLNGYIDIYLPDFKYMDNTIAQKYSFAPDYVENAKTALAEMTRQTGGCVFNADGIMIKGVIVRHLVLPSYTDNSKSVIEYLYKTYGHSIYMSIMNQYTPMEYVKNYPEINRKITDKEYENILDFAVNIGVENAFIQENGTVSESFIPVFDGEGIVK